MTSFPPRAQRLSAAEPADASAPEKPAASNRQALRSLPWAALLVSALVLTSCGSDSEADEQAAGDSGGGIPQPEYDDDETTQLPLAFVSPHGSEEGAPSGTDGNLENPDAPGAQEEQEEGEDAEGEPVERIHASEAARSVEFGCGDTVSVVRSEPLVTDDPATAAMNFLLDDQRYYHGDPSFINALAASEQQLSIESVEDEDGTAVVELSGEPITRSDCESWQIIVQLQVTARAATGADSAEILLDGTPLAEELGLSADDVPQVELRDVTD